MTEPSLLRIDAPHIRPVYRKLSVLMPVFNEQFTLDRIIERVLSSPVPLELELVAVDDRSRDSSWERLEAWSQQDSRVRAIRHPHNQGKGSAVRTAIRHMTGDLAVIQDADLEYDPHEIPQLLEPILEGKADAVFGSRYAGQSRQVLPFYHTMVNRTLTLLSNMLNDLTLTDMETCYKVVRSDILRELRLNARSFTLEPEITCRLAQWGARIHEVPISYQARTFLEGKKIRPIDGIKALWSMFHTRFIDKQFTTHARRPQALAKAKARGVQRGLFDHLRPYVGQRVLETSAGMGHFSGLLLDRERLVLTDADTEFSAHLHRRFGSRSNVRVDNTDTTQEHSLLRWKNERLDTVLCNLSAEGTDRNFLRSCWEILSPAGHCLLLAKATVSAEELTSSLTAAGFESIHTEQFGRPVTMGFAAESRPAKSLTKLAERCLPVGNQWRLAVGRKPRAVALQRAA